MADRPRIWPRPGRVIVLRHYYDRYTHPWVVWHGWKRVAGYATHAEAITAADKLAREEAA